MSECVGRACDDCGVYCRGTVTRTSSTTVGRRRGLSAVGGTIRGSSGAGVGVTAGAGVGSGVGGTRGTTRGVGTGSGVGGVVRRWKAPRSAQMINTSAAVIRRAVSKSAPSVLKNSPQFVPLATTGGVATMGATGGGAMTVTLTGSVSMRFPHEAL